MNCVNNPVDNFGTVVHSSKILTIQQTITRGVSSVGKPFRPEHGFPRPNCPGNALIFQKYGNNGGMP